METILKIEQITDYNFDGKTRTYYDNYDGYKITTNEQEILCLISNDQSCCESWGFFESQDDLDYFIGTELKDIKVVDKALDVKSWDKEFPYGLDSGEVMFINFETDKGTFQLGAYNAHNGYYGHTARLVSKQVSKEERI